MAVSPELLKELRTEGEDLDLSWLEAPAAERGLRIAPGKRGLTLEEIATGTYGDIPATSRNQSGRMRGAAPAPTRRTRSRCGRTARRRGRSRRCCCTKRQCSDSGRSATDVPWAELPDLPEDLELAMSQLCTFLTQVEFIAGDVPGQYAPNISGEYFEIGLFLASQIMDEARHLDVFRKRALVERHRPAAGRARRRQLADGAGLHRDGIDTPPRRRRLRAVAVPHGRDVRADRGRQAHVPARRAGREPPRRVRRHAHEVRDGDRAGAARRDPHVPRPHGGSARRRLLAGRPHRRWRDDGSARHPARWRQERGAARARATASCWPSASGRSTSTCTGSRSSVSATAARR